MVAFGRMMSTSRGACTYGGQRAGDASDIRYRRGNAEHCVVAARNSYITLRLHVGTWPAALCGYQRMIATAGVAATFLAHSHMLRHTWELCQGTCTSLARTSEGRASAKARRVRFGRQQKLTPPPATEGLG
jgi:hypothetical protein